MIGCENKFCVYNNGRECSLASVSLDITGTCSACIYVNISEDALSKKRAELLEALEQDVSACEN